MISRPILEFLRKQNRIAALMRRGTLVDLEQEMMAGKCHLVMGDDGPTSICRVVRVVVLRVCNKDGLVCVHLMQIHHGRRGVSKFHLPGSKVLGNERPNDAIKRLLETDLKTLTPAINICDVETVVEFEHSRTYGLETKYIKTIYKAELAAEMVRGAPPSLTETGPMKTRSDIGPIAPSSVADSAGTKNNKRMRASSKEPALARRSMTSEMPAVFIEILDFEAERPRTFGIVDKQGTAERPSKSTTTSSESTGARPSIEAACQPDDLGGGRTSLYRWMTEDEFESLCMRRHEVEQELTAVAASLSAREWQKFLNWELQGLDDSTRNGDAVRLDFLPQGPSIQGPVHDGHRDSTRNKILKDLAWTAVL